ncbi:hypothetical protein NPIL_506551 [Nephila pilipes]|uniref:Uncharacterized protein n=1 Tax=Nephila pilipes TaxID=299642 RepID=A0A8X6Q754_NEPPI|nr:hypothetical protein NPIL_506551 [Nephila pilipes]
MRRNFIEMDQLTGTMCIKNTNFFHNSNSEDDLSGFESDSQSVVQLKLLLSTPKLVQCYKKTCWQIVCSRFPFITYGCRIIQQDNAHARILCSTNSWMKANEVKTFQWPFQCPALNLMKNLWCIPIRDVYKNGRQYSRKFDEKAEIRNYWSKIDLKSIIICLVLCIDDYFQKQKKKEFPISLSK